MRDYKGMKRQRGRNRNLSSGGGGQQTGGKPGQNANRAFDSNGPDNIKVRGHAQHVYEKYNQLARDATSAGDRVLAENHLQHAEHYFRTLRVLQPNRPVTEIVGRDTFVGGFDLDFEDEALETAMAEADAAAAAQPAPQPQPEGGAGEVQGDRAQGERYERQDRPQQSQGGGDGQRREYRDRERPFQERDRSRADQPRRDRWEERGDRPQGERAQSYERAQGDRQQTGDRVQGERPQTERAQTDRAQGERVQNDRGSGDRAQGDRAQNDRQQSEKPRYENRRERWEERADRPSTSTEVEASLPAAPSSAEPPRAAFEATSGEGRVLRSEDGGVSHAPAFLSGPATTAPANAGDDSETRRPRARRPRRRVDEGQDGAVTEPTADEG